MSIELSDDGTMDTVLRCSECGEEFRFNYDPGPDQDPNDERLEALARTYPEKSPSAIADLLAEELYGEWIDACIEEAEAEHECPEYSIQTWFERDRAHVALYFGSNKDANDELVIEWWDDQVQEAIDDGFLNPKDYLASALAYARSVGLAKR